MLLKTVQVSKHTVAKDYKVAARDVQMFVCEVCVDSVDMNVHRAHPKKSFFNTKSRPTVYERY